MNILEITSGTGMNGAVLYCLQFARQLAARGHHMTIVCRPGSWIANELAGENFDVIHSNLNRWPLKELIRIANAAREREIDVAHTHMSRAHFFGVLLRWFAGTPSVASAQSRHIQPHWMLNDYVLAASNATRRFHRRFNFVPASRIETLPNFFDGCTADDPSEPSRQATRAEFDIKPDAKVIGMVGAVCRRKGLEYLVRALPSILIQHPNAIVLVIGSIDDPQYAERCRTLAARRQCLGQLRFARYRSDMRRILAALDVFALPTLEDAMPLAVLEAMAMRLPIVATSVGGIPDCVQDGESGTLVAPKDHRALASAIVDLLNDEERQQRFGNAGRLRLERHFSALEHCRHAERVFQGVIERRARPKGRVNAAAR